MKTTTFAETRQLAQRTVVDSRYPVDIYTMDPLWVLYDRILHVTPETADDPARDRFYLSKGHGAGAYYAVLAAKGFFPEHWLDDVASADSPLGGHPDSVRIPGVEIASGSLGHGLPLAVGTALGLRAQGYNSARVYVLIGDAEFDEGSNHEAVEYAGAVGLSNLTVLVADNASATHDRCGGVARKFAASGWTTRVVRGDDHDALQLALTSHRDDTPHVVAAMTD